MTGNVLLATLVVSGLLGVGVLGARAIVDEDVTLDQVPAAVRATILKESAGGKITEIERDTEDGTTVYELEFKINGKEFEIKIAADGTVLERDADDDDDGRGRGHEHADDDDDDDEDDDDGDDLKMAQVPKAARAALLKLAGGAKIVEVEREKEHGIDIYEAEWVANGTRHEAAVTADGTLVETEEIIPLKRAPAAVRTAVAKRFGRDAKVTVEKKMIVIYEVEGRVNGKEVELLVFPTGRIHEQSGDEHDDDDDDHDDDDHDHDDDHDDDDDD